MRFGLFYEHQLPRPWQPESEHTLLRDALEQIELADAIGIDYVWEVEHHFLEEYSHSSAPRSSSPPPASAPGGSVSATASCRPRPRSTTRPGSPSA